MEAASSLKQAFRAWDKDGSGTIDNATLLEILKDLACFSETECIRILGHFGEKVPYASFVDFLFGKEPPAGKLVGKVVIVTGAGSSGPGWGVGKAIAVAMAREGASLGLVDLNTAAAEETAAIIKGEGGVCAVLPKCDVSKASDVDAMVAACEAELGSVTTLVNNVGLVCPGDVTSVPLGKWDFINRINLMGAFNCTKTCMTSFLKSGKKCSIVNISSISSLRALRSEVAYASSKGGMNAMTHSIAREFAGRNIRCNCICPGIIETPLAVNAAKGADFEKTMAARHASSPTGKMGDAWDIAHACVYFGSDEASYANGVLMAVDGSFTMQTLPHEAGAPLLCPPTTGPSVDSAKKLDGKVAIITGKEFTGALTATFRRYGATVWAVDNTCDLTSPESVEAMVKKVVEMHGGVDILVNGSDMGIECKKSFETLSIDEFTEVYKHNATSVLLTMRFAIPAMLDRGGGAIVNMTSVGALRYTEPDCAGAAASASVNTMSIQTAAEFATKGVRCNVLVPFAMDKSTGTEGFCSDVANAAAHFCSPEARYTNGQIISIDMSQGSRVTVKV